MSQSLQGATFHIEHIVPLIRGGQTDASNLALACPSCNLHKGNRVSAIDPESDMEASLFHPRTDSWSEHFEWASELAIGLTATGRATLTALHFNHARRLRIRRSEAAFGLFPVD